MVKIEKHDFIETTSGAMNRLWKRQEQDFGIDLCWQRGALENGTVLRTKGERHDRHTPKQQAFRAAWCSCDVEYSNLPQSEKDEWRAMARRHGHSTGNNISGYNLFMKYCTGVKYEEVRKEFEDEIPDFWEPWVPSSVESYEVLDDSGSFEAVTEPITNGATHSLEVTDGVEIFNEERTWERPCLFSGYIRLIGSPIVHLRWGTKNHPPGSYILYGMGVEAAYDTVSLYAKTQWGFNWDIGRFTSIPSNEWLFFEFVIEEPSTVMVTIWDESDNVVESISWWDSDLDSGWFNVLSSGAGSGTAYISPVQLQQL